MAIAYGLWELRNNQRIANVLPVAFRTSSSPPRPYVLPAEFSLNPIAQRGPQGEIYISGTTNFPDGMKMGVVLGTKNAQRQAIVRDGQFRSGPFYDEEVPMTGNQPLEIVAYFTAAWQSKDVLAALGEGGKNLQGKLIKLTDPDVIDSDKMLDAKFTVSLPLVVPEMNAINVVKHAVLTVPGKGRSAKDIEQNLAYFMTAASGITAGKGWSATPSGPNTYNVVFDFKDARNGEKQAIWSVNTVTDTVRYVNEAAKLFSWTPNL